MPADIILGSESTVTIVADEIEFDHDSGGRKQVFGHDGQKNQLLINSEGHYADVKVSGPVIVGLRPDTWSGTLFRVEGPSNHVRIDSVGAVRATGTVAAGELEVGSPPFMRVLQADGRARVIVGPDSDHPDAPVAGELRVKNRDGTKFVLVDGASGRLHASGIVTAPHAQFLQRVTVQERKSGPAVFLDGKEGTVRAETVDATTVRASHLSGQDGPLEIEGEVQIEEGLVLGGGGKRIVGRRGRPDFGRFLEGRGDDDADDEGRSRRPGLGPITRTEDRDREILRGATGGVIGGAPGRVAVRDRGDQETVTLEGATGKIHAADISVGKIESLVAKIEELERQIAELKGEQ